MKIRLTKKKKTILLATSAYFATVVVVLSCLYSLVGSVKDTSGQWAESDSDTAEYRDTIAGVSVDEMRAVWIATVSNINYPSDVGLDAVTLASELDAIVESTVSLGANAIFFQVRPCADALYESELFVSSAYVSGRRGMDADADFDSLGYLIGAAHARGIAVHAWVNPVRVLGGSVSSPADRSLLCDGEAAKEHPEWCVLYADGKLYFDLGIPEVRSFVASGVEEIVRKYDVDGVVFDDYFYPYPAKDKSGTTAQFADSDTYRKYGSGKSLADFRRENVNALVRVCSIAVKKADKSCLFGISPYGVWRNKISDGGAGTSGLEAYSDIYCNALAFAREGVVDYIAPQLYWRIGDESCDFSLLCLWWSNALAKTKAAFLPCLAPYRYSSGSYDTSEITKQISLVRQNTNYAGFALYGYAALTDPALPVGEEVRRAFSEN